MFDFLPTYEYSWETTSITTVSQLVGIFINIAFGITLTVSVIALVYSGIQYTMSVGDVKAAGVARSTLLYSIIGMLLSLGALTLKTIIMNSIGINTGEITNVTPNF